MGTSSPKWYRNILELPLYRFIDCAVDGNVYALIVSGSPSQEELLASWEHIKLEYADAMQDAEYRMLTQLQVEVSRLDLTYKQILICIGTLRTWYCREIANKLNRYLQSSMKFDVRFPNDYEADLRRAKNRSAGIKIELALKQASLEAMLEKFTSGKPATRQFFASMLITLTDFAKVQITDKITVFEYCERIHRINQFYDSQKLKR